MQAKVNIRALLGKHLGNDVADAMAAKIDNMIAAKKSVAQIERAIRADLAAHAAKYKEWSEAICHELHIPIETVCRK